jgi:hypothetical protein
MSISFGIPPSERNLKALIGPRVKTGEKGTARSGSSKPVALEYFKVENSDGSLIEAFNDRPERLRIELVSDDIRDFWRDRLNVYDGRTCFCFNDAGGNTALRRSKSGAFQPVECNPARCALRLNETKKPTADDSKESRLTEYQQEIKEQWAASYTWAHLTTDSRCKSQTYFLFALPHPHNPGEYITRPGEYARYTSGSHNINNQLLKGLKDIYDSTQGRMRGLQVDLVMSFTSNAFGGKVPTVGIVGPSGVNELARAIADMSKRRGMQNIDMDKAMAELALLSVEELAEVDADYIYTHFYLGENQALPAGHETLALPAPRERIEVEFGTQDPLVAALIAKTRMPYVEQTKLQMKHGANIEAYRDELEAYAQKFNIDISQVLERYQNVPPHTVKEAALYLAVDMAAKEGAGKVHLFGVDAAGETAHLIQSQPAESEFTEVDSEPEPDADPDELFADLKRKFDSRQDS